MKDATKSMIQTMLAQLDVDYKAYIQAMGSWKFDEAGVHRARIDSDIDMLQSLGRMAAQEK